MRESQPRINEALLQSQAFRMGPILLSFSQLIIGRFVAGLLQFVALALVARHLGTVGFGHWGYSLGFVSFFNAATDLGLSTLMMRDLSLRGTKEPAYLGTVVSLKAVICLLAAISALVVDGVLNDDSSSRVLVWLLGAQMLVLSVTDLLYAIFRVRDRVLVEVALRSGHAASLLFVVIALTASGASASTLATGYLGAAVVVCVLATGIVGRTFVIELGIEWTLVRRLAGEIGPLGIGVLMTSVYYYFDAVYMGLLGQTEALGWYTAGYAFVLWVAVIVTALRNAFLPGQSQALRESGAGGMLIAYGRISFCAAILAAVGGATLARPVLTLVYGAEFEPGTFALQMLMIMSGFMFLSSFFGSNLIVLGHQKLYLAGVTAGAVTNVCLNLVLIPRYSLDGAAVATLVSEGVVFLSMAVLSSRQIPQFRPMDMVSLPLRAGAVLGITLLLGAQVLPWTVAGLLAIAAFLVTALKLGVLAEGILSEEGSPDVSLKHAA